MISDLKSGDTSLPSQHAARGLYTSFSVLDLARFLEQEIATVLYGKAPLGTFQVEGGER